MACKQSYCLTIVLGPVALTWVRVVGDPYAAEVMRTRGTMNTCSYFVSEGKCLMATLHLLKGS